MPPPQDNSAGSISGVKTISTASAPSEPLQAATSAPAPVTSPQVVSTTPAVNPVVAPKQEFAPPVLASPAVTVTQTIPQVSEQTQTAEDGTKAVASTPVWGINQTSTPTKAAASGNSPSGSVKLGKPNAEVAGVASMAPQNKDQDQAINSAIDYNATGFLEGLAGSNYIPVSVPDVGMAATIQDPVHLEEAVAFALKNNFEAQATSDKSNSAHWDKLSAYAEYLPTLDLSADEGYELSAPASYNDQFGNRVMSSQHHRSDYTIALHQPIIDLSVIADVMSAKHKQDIADIEGRDVREGVAYDTLSSYMDLLQARLSVHLADEYEKYLDKLETRMKSRVEGGGGTEADLERVRGRRTNAEAARVQALGDYEASVAELKRLTHVVPAQLVIPRIVIPPVPDDIQGAMERALKNNPGYLSSQKKIDLASDDRNKSFSSLAPKLSFQVNDYHSYNAGGAAAGNPVDGVYSHQDTQNVMLVAQWSFGASSIASGVSAVNKQREMTKHAMDIRSKLEQGIQSGYAALTAAHRREAALRKTVEADEKVVKGFDLQYEAGGRSLFDLLDAYEQLYSARLNLMRVIFAGAKASYQVRRQMGELVPTIMTSEITVKDTN